MNDMFNSAGLCYFCYSAVMVVGCVRIPWLLEGWGPMMYLVLRDKYQMV